jgi:hypothetical protein
MISDLQRLTLLIILGTIGVIGMMLTSSSIDIGGHSNQKDWFICAQFSTHDAIRSRKN